MKVSGKLNDLEEEKSFYLEEINKISKEKISLRQMKNYLKSLHERISNEEKSRKIYFIL